MKRNDVLVEGNCLVIPEIRDLHPQHMKEGLIQLGCFRCEAFARACNSRIRLGLAHGDLIKEVDLKWFGI